MALRIQFEKTRWGNVGFSTIGSGPPLLFDPGWFSDLDAMWRQAGYRAMVEHFAQDHTVMVFDTPGSGVSDRDNHLTSIDEDVELLELMLHRLGVSASRPVTLFGSSIAACTAIRYAAAHPERVSRLVLHGATATGHDLAPVEVREALLGLVRAHWGLGSRAISDLFVPGVRGEDLEWFDAWQRAATSAHVAAERLEMYYEADVTDDCSRQVRPALVLHRSGDRAVRRELGVRLAGLLPDAELRTLPGDAHVPFLGDWKSIVDAIDDFLRPEHDEGVPVGPYGQLTAREADVAELTVQGLTNAAIGDRLGISPRTVETHLTRIREKLGVGTRAEIAVWMTRARPDSVE